ncbi:retropepsin-like aspartic protease family protein [Hydrogenophaga aquatica]
MTALPRSPLPARLAGVLAAALALPCAAQTVDLTGTAGDRALLVINGGAPRFLAPGQSRDGVRVVGVEGDRAIVEVQGERRTLRLGDGPMAAAPARAERPDIVLMADMGGHFTASGLINGRQVRFLVDTGATLLAMSETEAQRIGLPYKQSNPVRIKTANGDIVGHQVRLNSVSVGPHTSHGVAAVVLPASMPFVLLGNSFLSRFDMRRENDRMILNPRY